VGVGDAFLRFDFAFDVGLGDGVGEAFLRFGKAVGDGVGVAFFAELFRCLRAGVGVGSRIFLIFVPNDSSAESAPRIVPNKIARIKQQRSIVLEATNFVGRLTRSLPLARSHDLSVHVARLPSAPFCETPVVPAPDTDALQFTRSRLTSVRSLLIGGDKISARAPGGLPYSDECHPRNFPAENSR
jgi:hypothetical protein